MKIKKLIAVALFSTLMIGCGGGGGDSDKGDDTGGGGIGLGGGTGGGTPDGGGTGSSNAQAEIQGNWTSPCIVLKDGSTAVQILTFGKTDDGTNLYADTFGFFKTGDCSGNAGTLSLLGPIKYSGSQTTSICVAEKFSATYVMAVKDGKAISDQKFSETKYHNQTISDIACVYKGSLVLGDGKGGINAARAYVPTKSKILSNSQSLKKNINDESIDPSTLKKMEELRKLLK